MANKRLFDLPQTKGEFQIRGCTSGVTKKNFFTDKKTKSGNNFKAVNFGIEYDDKQFEYVNVSGMDDVKVYFYSSKDKKTKEVAWKDRNKDQGEGYRLIGVNVGIEQVTDETGNAVNDKQTLAGYDAAEYIHQHLKDDSALFVKGSLEFDSYINDKDEVKRSRRLLATQVSLCSKDIDFEAEDFEKLSDFKMTIVYTGIDKEKSEDGKETGRFIVSALYIGYANIVPVEFIIETADLANKMRKGLKAYNSIEVTGKFHTKYDVETVEQTDDWGEKSSFDRTNSPATYELIITGAKPATIDTETYTEENIAEARKAIANKNNAEKSFGDKKKDEDAPWGDSDEDETENEW